MRLDSSVVLVRTKYVASVLALQISTILNVKPVVRLIPKWKNEAHTWKDSWCKGEEERKYELSKKVANLILL